MFYSHILLTKKGPLAKVWLAAHWDRKITKAQVFETNLCQSVDAIIRPQVRLSLRTSGHLLLGVVKLHSRKARYLLSDCNETLVGIKMAFRPEAVVVELGAACLPSTVTMPQIDLREAALLMEGYCLIGDLDINYDDEIMFQARNEDITIREEVISDFSTNMINDDFGYGNDEIMDVTGVDNIESFGTPSVRVADDSRRSNATKKCVLPLENETEVGVNSPYEFENDVSRNINDTTNLFNIPMTPGPPMMEDVEMVDVSQVDKPEDESVVAKTKDALVLQPIDAAQIGTIRKARRRRRLLVDEDKCLTSEVMRDHFNDRADVITELDLAPPTKDLMNWREYTCEKMMEMPVRFMKSKTLLQAFKSGLNLKSGNKNEARDKKAAKAVSDILNEPLIIANDDSDSQTQNQPRPPSPSDSAEIARLSMAGANTETNLSRDVIDEPMATEQSHIFDITGDQPSFAIDLEKHLSSSATKENRNANLSFPANESTTTPIKRSVLRPSARANVTPESPKMPSRVRKFEEPLSRKLFNQGMATPKTNYASGDDSFALPPLEPQTPGGYETPRRNTAFDVTSTYSPIGTVTDRIQQEEAIVEVEPVRREDRIKELFQAIYVELKTVNFTFKDALKQLESKSGKTMSRKRAASTFHALLELKKRGQIKVDQSTPFGDIRVVAIGG